MRTESSVDLAAPVASIAPLVSDLARYREWMPLVHEATPGGEGLWWVELRARVGVFARSKRLRMRRTIADAGRWVFERDEDDGRRHAMWRLEVRVEPLMTGATPEHNRATPEQNRVTMVLEYGGSLWTGGILDRVLASQIDAGKEGLARLVSRG